MQSCTCGRGEHRKTQRIEEHGYCKSTTFPHVDFQVKTLRGRAQNVPNAGFSFAAAGVARVLPARGVAEANPRRSLRLRGTNGSGPIRSPFVDLCRLGGPKTKNRDRRDTNWCDDSPRQPEIHTTHLRASTTVGRYAQQVRGGCSTGRRRWDAQ